MAGGNVDLFLRGAEAIGRGDESLIAEIIHPDVVFEPQRAATEGAFLGHEGIRRFIADNAETFDVFEPSFTDVRELGGGRVLAIGSIRVRGRASGAETEIPTAAIAEFRDGLLIRYRDYVDAARARAAAGRDSHEA